LIVNHRFHDVEVHSGDTLLHVLRERLGLRGTRFGCGAETCGACTVLVDGTPTYACTTPADMVAGHEVQTVEGLAGHALPEAFLAEQAGQCGYCLSGILMSAKALLDSTPSPTRAQIVAALDRHLCRCGAHNRIINAIQRAAATA